MNLVFLVGVFCLVLFLIEFSKRRFEIPAEVTRRCMHIGAAIMNLIAAKLVSYEAIILCNVAFAIIFLLGKHTNIFSSVQKVERTTYGDVCFPLGVALAAAVLLPDHMAAFQYGVAVMGFADALAGFVGERWGKGVLRLFGQKKTVVGSSVFFLVTVAITLLFVPMTPTVLLIACVLTGVELMAVFGSDNLVLPVVSGLLYSLLL